MIHQMTFPEPDRWDLPGGGLEPEESLDVGLRREVLEETGITDFRIEKLLTVTEGFFPKNESWILHGVNIVYQCSVASKITNLHSEEEEVGSKGIQWIPMASLTPDTCTRRSWEALQAAGSVQGTTDDLDVS